MILINLSLKLNELLHDDDDSVDDAPDGLRPFISINLPILFSSYLNPNLKYTKLLFLLPFSFFNGAN